MQNINDKALQQAAKRANINFDELKKANQNGKVEDYINQQLSPEASAKLKQVLSDKATTERLLATPEARELLNKLMHR